MPFFVPERRLADLAIAIARLQSQVAELEAAARDAAEARRQAEAEWRAGLSASETTLSQARQERDDLAAELQRRAAYAEVTQARHEDAIGRHEALLRSFEEVSQQRNGLVAERSGLAVENAVLLSKVRELEVERDKWVQKAGDLVGAARAANARSISRPTPRQTSADAATADGSDARRFFVIVSPGRSGTQWLTRALNSHPAILAVHAYDFRPDKHDIYPTPESFLESLERQNQFIAKVLTIDEMFDTIDDGSFKILGNIHGVPALNGDGTVRSASRPYFGSYLLRHPVARIRSVASRWRYEMSLRGDLHREAINRAMESNIFMDMITVGEKSKATQNEDALFIAAIDYVLDFERPYLKSDISKIIFERLMRDKDYLLWYVRELSGGIVDITDEFVDNMINVGVVDGRHDKDQYVVREYSGWNRYIKSYFQAKVDDLGMRSGYASHGYSL